MTSFNFSNAQLEAALQDAMDSQEKWMFSWITGRGNYNEPLLMQDLDRIAEWQYVWSGYQCVSKHTGINFY